MEKIDTRLKLSMLWLFILLNIIFRDIHQMTMKSHLEMLLTGVYNGTEITDGIMLFGAFLVEIPISLVLFSHCIPRKLNRYVQVIACVLFSSSFFFSPPTDMDDIFFLVVELMAIIAILRTSLTWVDKTG